MTNYKARKIYERLMGKTEVEDALERLNMLTQEENLMTVARTFEATHDVNVNVKATQELTQHVDTKVTVIEEGLQQVDGNVMVTQELTHHIDDNVMDQDHKSTTIHTDVEVINERTRTIDDNVKVTKDVMDDLRRNQSRSELRRWLSPPNPSVNHNTAHDTQHDGTANWFIQGPAFDGWKTNGSLLWIRGNPGSGKSILCSAIIEEIKHIRKSRSACSRTTTSTSRMLPNEIPGLADIRSLQLPSEAALTRCLKSMLDLPGQIPTYIVIDALDECPNNTGTPSARERVLNFVEDLSPEQDINTALNPLTPPSHRVSLHEEGGQMEDINSFVRSFVMNDRTMRRWRAEDKDLVIRVLSERAQGMFRWVYCQLDTLRRCMPSSIRKSLNELPITLDDTYERILQCIPKEKFQHAQLAEIFAIEFDTNEVTNLVEGWRPENAEEAVLSACSSLIAIIDDEGSKIVQFSHFSVKEYMTSDRLQTSDIGHLCDYYIPLEPAHTGAGRDISSGAYASKHWLDHAKIENVQSQIQDDLKHLFIQRGHIFVLAFGCITWRLNHGTFITELGRLFRSEQPPPLPATPLYYAVFCGFSELAKWLVTTQAEDVNAKCHDDRTPLHVASHEGHVDAVHVLLDHGAHVNAQERGNLKVVQLLLEHEATLNARSEANNTPVYLASREGHLEVVRLLLSLGADVHIEGLRGTPFQIATQWGHHDIAQLLLEHGAKGETITLAPAPLAATWRMNEAIGTHHLGIVLERAETVRRFWAIRGFEAHLSGQSVITARVDCRILLKRFGVSG
ncbi:hypothetical protein BGY98DRAFT_1096891 [Russula aff. rugulosa BPL654]|nr:hypothetical protein BGY98DRAFT_1096891 [Russula aff. rugulosa BPL654]